MGYEYLSNNGMIFSKISLNFTTTKYTADCFNFNSILPHPRVDINISICSVSLLCWTILNFNTTDLPNLVVEELRIEIWKHPSPLAKPAIQLGFILLFSLFIIRAKAKSEGLDIGLISGKDNFNSSDKPKLIEAFIQRTFIIHSFSI